MSGVEFRDFLKIKLRILMHNIIFTKTPKYLFQKLQCGRSSRRILLIHPLHNKLVSEWQFFFNAICLWNSFVNKNVSGMI